MLLLSLRDSPRAYQLAMESKRKRKRKSKRKRRRVPGSGRLAMAG
ncbi:hypothetical protein [Opitutus sp. ER46]|nr:hypothetical protein [Opitutus sp. ER46]